MKNKQIRKRITSARQAQEERLQLTSYWSTESQLSQRTLIYIVELLEKLVAQKRPRKLSEYQKHVAKVLKSGKTMQEAVKLWKERKSE